MRSEWKIATLSNLSVKTSYGYTASAKGTQENNEPKFLRITDIQGGIVNWENVPYCEIDNNKLDGYKLNYGDIVVARTGNSTGENYIFNSTETAVFASYLIRYVIDQNKAHPKFIWYQMRSNRWIGFINNVKGGSAQAGANAKTMGEFECVLPPLPTQKKIAHILSTLDDKIELNRKMNETLEAIAQALFKSWFVDFDPVHAKAEAKSEQELEVAASTLGISKEILDLFPSEFEESEMGMIPLGWEVKPLKDFGQVITGKTPSTKKKENYGVKYPFITIPDMHNQTFIVNTARYLSEEGHCVQSNKLIPKNSLMVSCIATVGLVSISSEDSHTNQQINSIICSENNLYFLYCMLSSITDKLIMYGGAGTATLNVNKNIFENIRVIKPVDILLDKFLELVKPMFEQILANAKEIQTLQKTRDTLLPKLLSGELDVSKLPIEIN